MDEKKLELTLRELVECFIEKDRKILTVIGQKKSGRTRLIRGEVDNQTAQVVRRARRLLKGKVKNGKTFLDGIPTDKRYETLLELVVKKCPFSWDFAKIKSQREIDPYEAEVWLQKINLLARDEYERVFGVSP